MSLDTKAEKAWQYLVDEAKKAQEKLPDEFTVDEFADEVNKTRNAARGFLDRKVENG